MFHAGILSLRQSNKSLMMSEVSGEDDEDDVSNVKCFIMMLDVLLKQVCSSHMCPCV